MLQMSFYSTILVTSWERRRCQRRSPYTQSLIRKTCWEEIVLSPANLELWFSSWQTFPFGISVGPSSAFLWIFKSRFIRLQWCRNLKNDNSSMWMIQKVSSNFDKSFQNRIYKYVSWIQLANPEGTKALILGSLLIQQICLKLRVISILVLQYLKYTRKITINQN